MPLGQIETVPSTSDNLVTSQQFNSFNFALSKATLCQFLSCISSSVVFVIVFVCV